MKNPQENTILCTSSQCQAPGSPALIIPRPSIRILSGIAWLNEGGIPPPLPQHRHVISGAFQLNPVRSRLPQIPRPMRFKLPTDAALPASPKISTSPPHKQLSEATLQHPNPQLFHVILLCSFPFVPRDPPAITTASSRTPSFNMNKSIVSPQRFTF